MCRKCHPRHIVEQRVRQVTVCDIPGIALIQHENSWAQVVLIVGIITIDGDVYGVRCLDDGTWESYDPAHEEYVVDRDMAELRSEYRSRDSVKCTDVTSYDYNWDNDVLCTNPDGSQFYTSYERASMY